MSNIPQDVTLVGITIILGTIYLYKVSFLAPWKRARVVLSVDEEKSTYYHKKTFDRNLRRWWILNKLYFFVFSILVSAFISLVYFSNIDFSKNLFDWKIIKLLLPLVLLFAFLGETNEDIADVELIKEDSIKSIRAFYVNIKMKYISYVVNNEIEVISSSVDNKLEQYIKEINSGKDQPLYFICACLIRINNSIDNIMPSHRVKIDKEALNASIIRAADATLVKNITMKDELKNLLIDNMPKCGFSYCYIIDLIDLKKEHSDLKYFELLQKITESKRVIKPTESISADKMDDLISKITT